MNRFMRQLLPEPIIKRIDQLLNDKSLAKGLRDSLLSEAADEGWNSLFPENVARLPADVAKQRWREVRTQLATHPNQEKILRVLESPASGERFYWLDG